MVHMGNDALSFTEPMECLPVVALPEGADWIYEVKLDGFRAQAIHGPGGVSLLSRRGNSFNAQFPAIVGALGSLPLRTAVDGELVALDPAGRPNFNLLQNHRSSRPKVVLFVFDLLHLRGRDLTPLPLRERKHLLRETVMPSEGLDLSEPFALDAERMLALVREHGLEGVVAKRLSSVYEPGRRTGAWTKYRLNLGQEFVIGG